MDQIPGHDEALQRPSEDEIKTTWREIYTDPLVSHSSLKAVGISKQGLGVVLDDGGIILRSVYWRHYHNLLPSPSSPDLFKDHLYSTRHAYALLRRRYLLAPDGRWASDCSPKLPEEDYTPDSPGAGPSRVSPSKEPGGKSWDPLSLESESPWKTWFAHQELRQTIRQDVDRTFPDIEYFTSEKVRKCMVSILFLYSILNPGVGYRQGMHELLAVCFWVLDRDSLSLSEGDNLKSPLARDPVDDTMRVTLDRRYVEHDAYSLFNEIMKSAKPFYEWRSEEKSSRTTSSQAPIITRCQHIHNNLIARIDPQLWERLETEGVEAQIWAIRWLRLIFTRELPFSSALRIWDGVFAEDPQLQLLDFICIAMLLLIRNELIEADYPTLLTQLLHYPAPSPIYPFDPSLILSQAMFLRDNVSPSSGVEVVLQNQDMLGVKAQPPERDRTEEPVPIRSRPMRGGTSMRGRPSTAQSQVNGQQRGVQGFAQGWIDRAQAAGLDKAVLSAVSDLRKNLPDTASAYSYLPNLPFSPLSPSTRDGTFSSIPTTASALPNRATAGMSGTYFPRPLSSPSPSPSTPINNPEIASLQAQIREQERQMAELRLTMLGMGKAMSTYLASPLDDKNRKGLENVRDALLEAGGREVEDMVKEWVWREDDTVTSLVTDGDILLPITTASRAPLSNPSRLSTPLSAPSPPIKSDQLSRSDSGPFASLPRVSQATRPSGMPTQAQSQVSVASPLSNGAELKKEADPLAGLGVRRTNDRAGQVEATRSAGGDPLGVGP